MTGIFSKGGSAGHRYAGWLSEVEAKNFQFGGKVFNGSPSAIYVGSNQVWPWLTIAAQQAIRGAFGQRDGKAVIKATNAYLNQLAASGQAGKDKATALAGFINYNADSAVGICQFFYVPELQAAADAGLLNVKQLADNSIFVQICHHHVKNATQRFNNATDAEYRLDSELFSVLKYTGTWLLNSKYEFLAEEYMLEGDTIPAAYRWSQTSNPYIQTSVSGYVNISNGHGGIYRYSSNTLMSTGVGGWFGDPGCYAFWQGGIPSFQGNPKVCKGTLNLWIRVG